MERLIDRVCLLVNDNLYGSKRHFTQKLAEALTRHEVAVKVIDAEGGSLGIAKIHEIEDFKPTLTASFNSFLPLPNGKFLWDILKIPHLSFLVDPALYSASLTDSPYSLLACVNRNDVAAVQSYGFEEVFFWPHAVEREMAVGEGERPYDVVLLGSCYDYEGLRDYWETELPHEVSAVLNAAAGLVFSDQKISLAEALVQCWGVAHLETERVDFEMLFYYLDYYIRGMDRVELVRAIEGAKVHIFGEMATDHRAFKKGWEHYCGDRSNVKIHPSISFAEIEGILQKSKVCLNSMPFFRDGTHERVFAGLACGAAVLSSESRYLREVFGERQGVAFYDSDHKESIDATVQRLLAVGRKEEALVGRAIVMQDHTWDARVGELLRVLPALLERRAGEGAA